MSDADYYCDCIHCQPELYCDECGAIEGNLGCPVCDALSHAAIETRAGSASATLSLEYPNGDLVGWCPERFSTVALAIKTALHHEAPVIRLRVYGDPREVSA